MMAPSSPPIGIGYGIGYANFTLPLQGCAIPSFLSLRASSLPTPSSFNTGTVVPRSTTLNAKTLASFEAKRNRFSIRTIKNSSSSDPASTPSPSPQAQKTPFGYTRKDVLLIGLGVTFLGIALKAGLEFVGVDPLQAGNVVQLVLVLGLTVGWISTYIFRVSNKEMTYAQQLRDYESKVMEKRLESLTEAELEALLEEIEEEKRR
ncbi:hypothetical protein HN51_013904 [Arachis hypogaea]|uniref:uncharacterized protein LOC107631747 n=1 Tax=Arachis ipaensis TaxID=130454 RepID=UPI0007AFA69B|nr:uncharacterized protein LOC107631747 [Arachis ipaensis]XP_020975458.1 uncharacterized protein LOC107631747 [Arachis ipaensis]XP_025639305.1 uncharacterized protein LOC112734270 [Arachis hypogaea]XP_025639306.1 uncharacterized protein LOC112734270 [Arachis hypogaea]QHO59741.1 uncharacterized protein DS421_3g101530 [Arachis hypogaea]